jgi:hydroxymethylglutaryl-CoA reductase
MKTSRIPGFYKLSPEERLRQIKEFADLTEDEVEILRSGGLTLSSADKMIENVFGIFSLPLGIATNFLINGKDYLVPMVTEEPSVVAAASNGARMVREGGGFRAKSLGSIMIGQIHVWGANPSAREVLLSRKEKILQVANQTNPTLVELGGGAKDLEIRVLNGEVLVVHLLVDVKDAMGANTVNGMCEAVAPLVEQLTGGKVLLRILSNLAIYRLVEAEARVPKEVLGEEVVKGIVKATEIAKKDPFRCATHNKGIMNGIVAVALATGNDTRAVEAGAHSYASLGGYHPLTEWEQTSNGDLYGRIRLPLAVGTVGGATHHPLAKVCRKILGVQTAAELAEVMASVGLAQNLAALRALVSEGIQRGHMKLHARSLALAAGATGERAEEIARRMVEEGEITLERAKELLENV